MSATQEVQEIFGAGNGPAHSMLRSPTVLIAAIGLWGMNIYLFRVFGIDYVKVLRHDLIKIEEQDVANTNTNTNTNSQQGSSSTPTPPSGLPLPTKRGRKDAATVSNATSRGGGGGGGIGKDVEYCGDGDTASYASDSVSKIGAEQQQSMIEDDEVSIMEAHMDDSVADRITPDRLVWLSVTLLLLLHSTYTIWIHWLGGGSISAVFAFYGAVTTAILLPLPSTRWLRTSAVLVIQRALELVNPRCYCCSRSHYHTSDEMGISSVKAPRPIPFVDVFFADAMCSLSKVFFDWGLLIHMAAYYPNAVPKSVWHILIPSAAAAVPYIIRARQCLIMWTVTSLKNDPTRFAHLWNALKYCTSIFPLCLSAYQKTVSKEKAAQLETLLIVLLIVNAGYALWWDVVMDWGMMKNIDPAVAATVICNPVSNVVVNGNTAAYSAVPRGEHPMEHRSPLGRNVSGAMSPAATLSCWHRVLRSRLRFGVAMSLMILGTDVVLRFSWLLRFYHKLFPSTDIFVLSTQFLEVVRRALWNLLRVEWENLKQSGHHHHTPHHPVKPPSSIQLMLVNEEEKQSFLSRGNASLSKLTNGSKITVEKNAEA